jgi:putative component of membrane protein insertase Oxa1/YidC/SpoIIIJ protein YidD
MKYVLLAAIWLYRRLVSPYKGFSCAWRIATGGASCSAYGRRVIARFGTARGIRLLRRRMRACSARRPVQSPTIRLPAHPSLTRQRGSCDIPSCDIPSCDIPSCDTAPWDAGWFHPVRWLRQALDCGCCDLLDCIPDGTRRERRRRASPAQATSAPAPSPPR